jgi:hypothetical protein
MLFLSLFLLQFGERKEKETEMNVNVNVNVNVIKEGMKLPASSQGRFRPKIFFFL